MRSARFLLMPLTSSSRSGLSDNTPGVCTPNASTMRSASTLPMPGMPLLARYCSRPRRVRGSACKAPRRPELATVHRVDLPPSLDREEYPRRLAVQQHRRQLADDRDLLRLRENPQDGPAPVLRGPHHPRDAAFDPLGGQRA